MAPQDPAAAADEAERAVRELGLKGILVNGYTGPGDFACGLLRPGALRAVLWMDTVPISEGDRPKIGRDNAARLLGL